MSGRERKRLAGSVLMSHNLNLDFQTSNVGPPSTLPPTCARTRIWISGLIFAVR